MMEAYETNVSVWDEINGYEVNFIMSGVPGYISSANMAVVPDFGPMDINHSNLYKYLLALVFRVLWGIPCQG